MQHILLKLLLLQSFSCAIQVTFSQTIERQLISNAGDYTNVSAQISWSLGEPVTEFYLDASNHLTQGFQQGEFTNLVLPAELIDFQASRIDEENVMLHWQTALESDVDGFWIQRKKADEEDFQNIHWKASKAENEGAFYEQIDENDFHGLTFYRLKIVDTNDEFSLSPIRVVEGLPLENLIAVYPNPTKGNIQISINIDARSTIDNFQIQVFNAAGKNIFEQNYFVDNQLIALDVLNSHPPGNYWIVAKTNTGFSQILSLVMVD